MARSPNYPQLSLKEAIDGISAVWKAEQRNRVGQEAIAKHLGYGSLNGSAQVAISALRKFGFLDGRADRLVVSEDAVILLEGDKESAEYSQALQRAALRPALFEEIRADNPSVPTEENLRFQLLKKGFNRLAANKAARTYRETIALAFGTANGDNKAHDGEASLEKPPEGAKPSPPVHAPLRRPEAGMKQDVFTLDQGEAVLQWPSDLSREGLQDVRDWLELVLRKMKRGVAGAEDLDVSLSAEDQPPAANDN